MDPNYAAVASDINRLLPEQYECINVTPVRRDRTWDEEGKQILRKGYTPVHNASIADFIGVQVVVKDEYREPWWNEIGGQPQVLSVHSVELFNEIAGVADAIVSELVVMLEAFIDTHRPKAPPEEPEVIRREKAQAHKGEVVEGAGSKGTPKKMSGAKKKKATTK